MYTAIGKKMLYFIHTIAVGYSTTKFFCFQTPVLSWRMFCRRKYFWLRVTWSKYSSFRRLCAFLFSLLSTVIFLILPIHDIRRIFLMHTFQRTVFFWTLFPLTPVHLPYRSWENVTPNMKQDAVITPCWNLNCEFFQNEIFVFWLKIKHVYNVYL